MRTRGGEGGQVLTQWQSFRSRWRHHALKPSSRSSKHTPRYLPRAPGLSDGGGRTPSQTLGFLSSPQSTRPTLGSAGQSPRAGDDRALSTDRRRVTYQARHLPTDSRFARDRGTKLVLLRDLVEAYTELVLPAAFAGCPAEPDPARPGVACPLVLVLRLHGGQPLSSVTTSALPRSRTGLSEGRK
jgi:hypothetical protein